MVNCNPETVSTDYDTSDRLYFEPLTLEDVLEVYHAEAQAGPVAGVIVQLGGQTPLKLAQALKDAGVPIVGTSPEAINLAEERGAFGKVLADAGLPAPRYGMADAAEQALRIAHEIGYPVLVRPSLRARRPRHGDRLRRRIAGRLHRAGHRHHPRPPGAGRPLPRRRHRDRRGRPLRRHRAVPRRRDGAHRGGRHPLRRLGLRAAADHAGQRGDRADPALHRGDRPRASASAACSTSSSRCSATSSTCSRPTRGRRAPSRSSPRPPTPRWPRPPPGSAGRRRSPSCAPRACCAPAVDGTADAASRRRSRSRRR